MRRNGLRVVKDSLETAGGIVVAEVPQAAEAGARMFERGGNAVDAAVAAAFAAGVAEPFMSGIGGGGYMVVRPAATGRAEVIEFIMRVPSGATPEQYPLDPAGGVAGMFGWPAVVGRANVMGYRAPAVPGAVAGLALALERHGRLSLAETLEPAIELAEAGVETDWYLALNIAAAMDELRQHPYTASILMPHDRPPRPLVRYYDPAERLVQADLARTLRRIAAHGPAEFYEGETARLIDADMRANGGFITAQDLAAYRPRVYEQALHGTFRDYDLWGAPYACACSTVIEMLNILEQFDLAALGWGTAEALHLVAEAQRLSFADRFAYMADPEFADVPWDGIVSKDYAAQRAARIDPARTANAAEPGEPGRFQPVTGGVARHDASCTTHISVIDRDRTMVSLTNTLGELFGARVTIHGTGVLLNDGMVWFDPRPGRPNSIAPGKRPLCNMAPFLVTREGRPVLAIGAPGARRVITGVMQGIHNVLEHGLPVQAAVERPRVHCETDTTFVDTRFPAAVLARLEAMGHRLWRIEETFAASNFARPVGVQVDEANRLHSGVHLFQPATACAVD